MRNVTCRAVPSNRQANADRPHPWCESRRMFKHETRVFLKLSGFIACYQKMACISNGQPNVCNFLLVLFSFVIVKHLIGSWCINRPQYLFSRHRGKERESQVRVELPQSSKRNPWRNWIPLIITPSHYCSKLTKFKINLRIMSKVMLMWFSVSMKIVGVSKISGEIFFSIVERERENDFSFWRFLFSSYLHCNETVRRGFWRYFCSLQLFRRKSHISITTTHARVTNPSTEVRWTWNYPFFYISLKSFQ